MVMQFGVVKKRKGHARITYRQQDVVELEVSVHHTETVQVVAAREDLPELLRGHHLVVVHGVREVVVQVASVHQLEDDPQALGRLVQLVHGHDVAVAYALHDLNFCAHALRIVHVGVLLHDLAGKLLTSDFVCHAINLTRSTVTQNLAHRICFFNHGVRNLVVDIKMSAGNFSQ